MKFLTHCLALGALLILHSLTGATVVDTHEEQELYDIPDFPCYELVLREDTIPQPEAESEVLVDIKSCTAPVNCAGKTAWIGVNADKDYG